MSAVRSSRHEAHEKFKLCFRELNASTNAYEWASRLHLIHKNTQYCVSFFKTGDKGLAGTMDPFGWLIWDRIIRFSARHTWRSRTSSSLNSEGKIGAEILFCTFIYYRYFQVQSCSKIGYSDCNGILFFFFATKTDQVSSLGNIFSLNLTDAFVIEFFFSSYARNLQSPDLLN